MRVTTLSLRSLVALGWLSLPLAAQTTRSSSDTRLIVAAGPSETVGSGSPIRTTDGAYLVGPAGDGFHAAFGVARAIRGSALELRGEVLFSRVTGGHATYLGVDYGVTRRARMAQRAESYALVGGLTCRAFTAGRWTPYLITAVGLYNARLGTNPNDQEATVTETYSATNPGVNAGAGILMRLGTREGFFEARRHELLGNQRGGSYVPLSFGLRW